MKNAIRPHESHALLTIAEIAHRFSLPESTARYYCKRFIDYLPHVGEGKRRRYRAGALDVFAVVLEEMKKSKNAMAVEALLSSKFPKNIDVLPHKTQQPQYSNNTASIPSGITGNPAISPSAAMDASRFLAFMEQQSAAMVTIASALSTLAGQGESVRILEHSLREKETEISRLRCEVEQLKGLQNAAEKLHQQDLDQMRNWLGKLLRSKEIPPQKAEN